MTTASSREARSARREAMKTSTVKKQSNNKGRVSKQASKKASTKAKQAKLPTEVHAGKPSETEARQAEQIKPEQTKPEETKQTEQSSPEQTEKTELEHTEQSLPEQTVPEQAEPVEMLEAPQTDIEVSTPPPFTGFEPLTPTSPPTEKLALEPTLTDEELQTYIREFEAVYQGTDSSEAEDTDVGAEPLTPELEAVDSGVGLKPMSPLAFDMSYSDLTASDMPCEMPSEMPCEMPGDMPSEMPMPSEFTLDGPRPEELKFDDYIDYTHDDTETEPVTESPLETRRRLCVYRNHPEPNPALFSLNPNKRTLVAAWQTVVADAQYSSREAYLHSVLLTAASLNQRSLLSGLARQTMAPALGTSH